MTDEEQTDGREEWLPESPSQQQQQLLRLDSMPTGDPPTCTQPDKTILYYTYINSILHCGQNQLWKRRVSNYFFSSVSVSTL